MTLQLIDGRTRIAAAIVAKALHEESLEPYLLNRHVIEGDLDLHFSHITRCIDITGSEFTGRLDVRNAIFDGTTKFRDCIFRGDINAGDEELAHTLFKSDLYFDGSTFHSFVSFIGFRCEASASFKRCMFAATVIRNSEMMGPRRPVEFNGGHVGKAFSVNKSVFKGCATFNALCCGLAGFFHDARFESREALPVDFVASSYGVALELSRAVFNSAVDLSGVSCGLFINADLARFNHPENTVNFSSLKTDYFSACGVSFAGPVIFGGLHCSKDVNFLPFVVNFDYPADEQWSDGDIPQRLEEELIKQLLPSSSGMASLVRENGMWALQFIDNSVLCPLYRDGNQVSIIIPSAFLGPIFNIAYAEIGLNLFLQNAVIKAEADFSNLLCKGTGNFDGAQFAKNVFFWSSRWEGDINLNATLFEGEVSFILCHLRNLYARGSNFLKDVNFDSFVCYEAFFDTYDIPLADAIFSSLTEGRLPSGLIEVFARNGFHIGDSCALSRQNDIWMVLDKNAEQLAFIVVSGNQPSLRVISRFFGENLSFNLGQAGVLMMDDVRVKGKATFNALHCTAGAFFRRTQFNGSIDFKYGEYDINLQMEGMQVNSNAEFERISIHSDLVLSERAIFHEGANFTSAKFGRLKIGASDPFRNRKSIFIGCNFDFFEGLWIKLVNQQDPRHFSLDPYLVLERCERAAGRHDEADNIYHKGRSRETRHALTQLQLASFFRGLLWGIFAGYGVRRFRAGIWCLLVIALGIWVFWPDDALFPAGEVGGVAQLIQSPSNLGRNLDETCTTRFFDNSFVWITAEQPEWLKQARFSMNFDGYDLDRFVSRLAFSVDEFVPVDLEIAKLCRPVTGWRKLYSAIHILLGWILIPLLVAAMTGFLEKR